MTRYETLINKANKCWDTARKTSGRMRKIWASKATALENKAKELKLYEVSK